MQHGRGQSPATRTRQLDPAACVPSPSPVVCPAMSSQARASPRKGEIPAGAGISAVRSEGLEPPTF